MTSRVLFVHQVHDDAGQKRGESLESITLGPQNGAEDKGVTTRLYFWYISSQQNFMQEREKLTSRKAKT